MIIFLLYLHNLLHKLIYSIKLSTWRTRFFDALTRKIPSVLRPYVSKWFKHAATTFGTPGSSSGLLAAKISADELHDKESSRPGTLPTMRLSQEPL